MGLTGFNENTINECLRGVTQAYSNLNAALRGETQKSFVNEMPKYWASPDAVKFFGEFKTNFDALIDETNTVYDSIYNSITSAGQYWAQATGLGMWYPSVTFTKIERKIDITCITDKFSDGNRGVYEDEAQDHATVLEDVLANINTQLQATYEAAENSGFLGQGQQEQLRTTLEALKNKMKDVFGGQVTAVKGAIKDTVTAYQNISSDVKSKAFGKTQQ